MKKTAEIKGRNLISARMRRIRESKKPPLTLEDLAAKLQVRGVDLGRSAVNRIELNQRYVLDYELTAIAYCLKVSELQLLYD